MVNTEVILGLLQEGKNLLKKYLFEEDAFTSRCLTSKRFFRWSQFYSLIPLILSMSLLSGIGLFHKPGKKNHNSLFEGLEMFHPGNIRANWCCTSTKKKKEHLFWNIGKITVMVFPYHGKYMWWYFIKNTGNSYRGTRSLGSAGCWWCGCFSSV